MPGCIGATAIVGDCWPGRGLDKTGRARFNWDARTIAREIGHGRQRTVRSRYVNRRLILVSLLMCLGLSAVAAGAERGSALWSFQPAVEPVVPPVRQTKWPRTPIDHFILAELEAEGLTPAPHAERRTLLRRMTFDLIGLPPTLEEVEDFLGDDSPQAVETVIERLLASPHYGQRWGRHWLDVARYADSNGMDENLALANAFRYRDWVVDALNRDLPFDQFVREQLAGDLLPDSGDVLVNQQRIIATAFLSLGPKMLAEDDAVKMEMDIVDEQVDAVGRAFMGLTLGCARCHDHKFDPVDMHDYYALAGIFRSTKTMDNFQVVARWHERPLGTRDELARLDAHRKKVEQTTAEIKQRIEAADDELRDDALERRLAELESEAPKLCDALAVEEGTVQDVAIHIRGSHLTLGAQVPRRFPRALEGEHAPTISADRSGRIELADWLTQPDHPLTSRVMVNRIWRWHFGEGIVRTVDNFGRMGEPPANQALLDWLARRFVETGWSIKQMHRLIMQSATYQMSTAHNEHAASMDPDNRLHWRMNRRRLEAEAIRDAILLVSGRLDHAARGSLLDAKNREYVTGTASVNATRYDSRRRSLYLPVIRSALYDVFQAFDFADPSTGNGDRETTTVAPQAMFLLNSRFVHDECGHLAERLLTGEPSDDANRVAHLYRRALGRPPSAAETARSLEFVKRYAQAAERDDARHRAWLGLCRVVLSSNEFIYVD